MLNLPKMKVRIIVDIDLIRTQIAFVGVLLLFRIVNAELDDDKKPIEVVSDCDEEELYKSIEIAKYCVPENIVVTHIHTQRNNDDGEFKYTPVCGDKLCPSKERDCPPGFLDGKIKAACVYDPCGLGYCIAGGGSPDDIHPRVLVTLIG